MAVYQEKDKGTWRVVFRYTDFTGERKQTQKRGFKTKREATAWEHEMMLQKGNKLDMTFESFYEMYSEYKRQRVKESTFETKSHIVRTKRKSSMRAEISGPDVRSSKKEKCMRRISFKQRKRNLSLMHFLKI